MKFIVHIPVIEPKSAGVRVLLYLNDLLVRAGYRSEVNGCLEEEHIVIYPDLVRGNPLGARNIIRYMLYFAEKYYGGDRIPDSNCVFVYHDKYYESVASHYDGKLSRDNVVWLPMIEPGMFYPEEKTVEEVLYLGKQTVSERPEREMPVITRENMSRDECAKLIRSSKNLYSLDHHSAILVEAALSGCKPWLVKGPDQFEEAKIENPQREVQIPDRDVWMARWMARLALDFFKMK